MDWRGNELNNRKAPIPQWGGRPTFPSAPIRSHLNTLATLVTLLSLASLDAYGGIRHAPFDPKAYAPYVSRGTARISGQGFARTKGGDIKSAAGCKVLLTPLTSTSQAWLESIAEGGFDLDLLGPRVLHYSLLTTADAEGRFKFSRLAGGSYLIVTSISWQYGLGDKESVEVILAGRVRVARAEHADGIVLEPVGSRTGVLAE